MRDTLNNSNTRTPISKTKNLDTRQYKTKTPIIVGFDPGLTVGLAILDLNGNLLFLDSFKEISKSEIITIIMKYGKTILVATDVEHIPKAVKKLASALNAKVVFPKREIPVSYKNKLVNEFLKNCIDFSPDSFSAKKHTDNQHKFGANSKRGSSSKHGFNSGRGSNSSKGFNSSSNYNSSQSSNYNQGSVNDHERDSLSAAILAYNNYKKKLDQLEKKFLEAKINLNSIDKETIVNENYYNILNKAKSFLIDNSPIAEAISKAFEAYGLVDNEDIGIKVPNGTLSKDTENQDKLQNEDIENNLEILEEKLNKLKNIKRAQDKRIKSQDKIIETLNNKNKSLLEELNEKNDTISKIERDLKELKLKESKEVLKDKELSSKIKLLKNIQLKYKEEKEIRKSLEEKLNKRLKLDDFDEMSIFTPIKIASSFTKNGLNETNKLFKLKRGDVIYLSSSEGGGSQTAKFIVDIGVKAVIISKSNETIPPQAQDVFETENVPILKENDLDIKFFEDYAVVDTKELDKKIANWKRKLEDKSTKKAQNKLLSVINEYRVGRKRRN